MDEYSRKEAIEQLKKALELLERGEAKVQSIHVASDPDPRLLLNTSRDLIVDSLKEYWTLNLRVDSFVRRDD